MNKYEIKLFNGIDRIPKSIYYIERETEYGVENHIKVMKSLNTEFKFVYKKIQKKK